MTHPAIKVEGLSKEYIVGHARERHGTFYDLLASTLKAPLKRLRNLGGQSQEAERFWALQDVSFEVQPGEVVGVIGRNGAGKSTLLKILSRITAPTKGRIEVRGRLASLLEVGTGFHPELSGRENIYLNGAILGMTQEEVARKFDEIVDFSGVAKFIDTPVKRYSSGMYVRLAFAVAAHVDADILLIDEVLAVGDAAFQKRCLGAMGDVARNGKAIIFVSHNLNALRNLCSTGLLLNNGQIQQSGSIDHVISQYVSKQSVGAEMYVRLPHRLDDNPARITHVEIFPKNPIQSGSITIGTSFGIVIGIEVTDASSEFGVFLSCFDENQNRIFSSGSFFEKELDGVRQAAGFHDFECLVPGNILNSGTYSLDVSILRNRSEIVQQESTILSFRVSDESIAIEGWHWPVLGIVRPLLSWKLSGGIGMARRD